MPTAITDYHETIRDAVKDTIDGLALGLDTHAVDDIEDALDRTKPCIAVACVGPEQDRQEMSTNRQSGKGYSVVVMLLTGGLTSGEQTPGAPSITNFRRRMEITFHLKRLSGVTQVGWCEISDAGGGLFDEKNPKFQALTTAQVVTAVGRFPRS